MTFSKILFCLGLACAPLSAAAQSGQVSCGTTYTVGSGDTLSRISIKAYGVSAFEVIYDANVAVIGDNPNRLLVGQKLLVPCRGVAPTQAAVTTQPQARPASETTSPTEPVVLTFNRTSDPRFVINAGIIDPYLALIETATQGRVQFVDPTTVVRDPSVQFMLVTTGMVDGAYVLNTHLEESHPLLRLPMLPLMGGSAEQTAVSLWNLHNDFLAQSGYFDDAHLLGFIAAPAAHIWRRLDAPVAAGQDILAQNKYAVPYFDGLDTIGPQRVQQINAEMYGSHNAAQDGALTFMMAHGAARGGGIWNPERGVTEVENGVYTPTFSVVLSNEAWARISPADQDIITQISGLALAERSGAWDDFDNGHRGVMLETGLDVAYPDGALLKELEDAAQVGLATWSAEAEARGIPARQAIASYRANLLSLRYLLIFR